MLKNAKAFSSFSTDDLAKAKEFYGRTLGLKVSEDKEMSFLNVRAKGTDVLIYPKGNAHKPATFTVLNFMVDDIERAVDELVKKGIKLERYDNMNQDAKGIARGRAAGMGPDVAWFKDLAGNILALVEEGKA